MATDTDTTLVERGKRYGNYRQQTEISREIRRIMVKGIGNKTLESDQEDALTMIAVKISRIINGDPDYSDNWRDISGYATLVADRLDGNERK